MPALHSSDATFDNDVRSASAGGTLAIVDVWAPWCGPCRMVSPILDRLHDDSSVDVSVVKVNADENPEITQRYNVVSIPTLMFFREGELVKTIVGARNEVALRAEIEQLA